MRSDTYILEVWGDYACFTDPITKVERMSYPCPTPSAARGIFDAIYLERETFGWRIEQIDLIEPGTRIALMRNEVKGVLSVPATKSAMARADGCIAPLYADGTSSFVRGGDTSGRTQRQMIALRRVRYRLHGHMHVWPDTHPDKLGKICAEFTRRASRGMYFTMPYLGMREFPADFRLLDGSDPLAPTAPLTCDFGQMIYDVFDLAHPAVPTDVVAPSVSVFAARAVNGVVRVPAYESAQVMKGLAYIS